MNADIRDNFTSAIAKDFYPDEALEEAWYCESPVTAQLIATDAFPAAHIPGGCSWINLKFHVDVDSDMPGFESDLLLYADPGKDDLECFQDILMT